MFEQIFGSKTRVKLMKLFLENPEKKFYVRELTRLTDALINSIRREIVNLIEIGLVIEVKVEFEQKNNSNEKLINQGINNKKYYKLNKYHLFRRELESLFAKEKIIIEKNFTDKLLKVGNVKYLALSGVFVNDKRAKTDLIMIGSFEKEKVQQVIKQFEDTVKRQINYTLMDLHEYKLRKDIADRFLNDIINNEQNIVIVDDLKNEI